MIYVFYLYVLKLVFLLLISDYINHLILMFDDSDNSEPIDVVDEVFLVSTLWIGRCATQLVDL